MRLFFPPFLFSRTELTQTIPVPKSRLPLASCLLGPWLRLPLYGWTHSCSPPATPIVTAAHPANSYPLTLRFKVVIIRDPAYLVAAYWNGSRAPELLTALFCCRIASPLPCLTLTLHLLSLPHLKGWGRNPRETQISLSHAIVTKNSSHTGETWICPARATGLWTQRTSIQPCFYRSIALLTSSNLQFRAFWSQKGAFVFTPLKASSPSPCCII